MGYFGKYFLARGAYDTLRASARASRVKRDFIPADMEPVKAELGMEVLWMRLPYPVTGHIIGWGLRGIHISVTKITGEETTKWIDPKFLLTPTKPITK